MNSTKPLTCNGEWVYRPRLNVLQLLWSNGNVRYEIDLDRTEMDWLDHLRSTKCWFDREIEDNLIIAMLNHGWTGPL